MIIFLTELSSSHDDKSGKTSDDADEDIHKGMKDSFLNDTEKGTNKKNHPF